MSLYPFEEHTQIKHVMIDLSGEVRKAWHYTIFGDAE
jgi:betaine-aldehyde dehydrogenase